MSINTEGMNTVKRKKTGRTKILKYILRHFNADSTFHHIYKEWPVVYRVLLGRSISTGKGGDGAAWSSTTTTNIQLKRLQLFEMASLDLSGKGSLFSLVVPFLDLKGDETRGKSIFKGMKRDVFLLGGGSQMSKFGLNSWCCFDSQGAQTHRNVRNYKVVWPRVKQTEPTQGRVPNMCSLPVTTRVFRTGVSH